MDNNKNTLAKLHRHYFWDVDLSKTDPEKSKRLIIKRVFSLGGAKDMKTIISYYGPGRSNKAAHQSYLYCS